MRLSVCGEIAADTIREIGFCVFTEPYLEHYPQAPNQPSTLGGPLEGEKKKSNLQLFVSCFCRPLHRFLVR